MKIINVLSLSLCVFALAGCCSLRGYIPKQDVEGCVGWVLQPADGFAAPVAEPVAVPPPAAETAPLVIAPRVSPDFQRVLDESTLPPPEPKPGKKKGKHKVDPSNAS